MPFGIFFIYQYVDFKLNSQGDNYSEDFIEVMITLILIAHRLYLANRSGTSSNEQL